MSFIEPQLEVLPDIPNDISSLTDIFPENAVIVDHTDGDGIPLWGQTTVSVWLDVIDWFVGPRDSLTIIDKDRKRAVFTKDAYSAVFDKSMAPEWLIKMAEMEYNNDDTEE